MTTIHFLSHDMTPALSLRAGLLLFFSACCGTLRSLRKCLRPGRLFFRAAVFTLAFSILPAILPHMTVSAETVPCGHTNCTWNEDWTEVTISAQGPGRSSLLGRLFENYPTLKKVIIEDGVTSIRDKAFFNLSSLLSVSIPASVESIGVMAFDECTNLSEVTITPGGLTSIGEAAFRECDNLTSFSIPAGVTSIGNDAFESCDNLKSVSIPASVTSIGNDAFESCGNLVNITIARSNVTDPLELGADIFTRSGSAVSPPIIRGHAELNYEDTGGAAAVFKMQNGEQGFTVIKESGQQYLEWKIADATGYDKLLVSLQAKTPEISPASGTTFDESLEVTISCGTAGAAIYYTTDGSDPTTGSALYTGPFTITESVTVKAIAVKEDIDNSEITSAQYTKNQYTVTLTADPNEGGTVSGDGTFDYGKEITVTAAAKEHYSFVNWTEKDKNGEDQVVCTDPTYTFTVEKDRTLTANFKLVIPNITVIADPDEGGVVGGGSTYLQGNELQVWATPNEHYVFVNWTEKDENGKDIVVWSERTYTFEAQKDRTLTAHFKMITHEVSAAIDPAGGGTVTGAGAIDEGTKATLTAIPNAHYSFVKWTEDGKDLSTEPSIEIDNVMEDHNLTAHFEKITHEISAEIDPVGGGTVTGTGTFDEGTTATLTATANTGYYFENWEENGTVTSTVAAYSFTVESARSLTAKFTEHTHDYEYSSSGYVITVKCKNSDGAHVGSNFTLGTVTITAANKTYDGTAVTATVEKSENFPDDIEFFDVEYENEDGYSLSGAPKDAGKYYAVLTVKKNGYSARQQFVIAPCPLTEDMVTLDPSSFLFDGGTKIPSVIVKHGDKYLSAGRDYDPSGDTSAEAVSPESGYKITVSGKRNYTGSVSKYWRIVKDQAVITSAPTASAITFGQTLADSTLSGGKAEAGGKEISGTFSWKDPVIKPSVSDSDKTPYAVTFTPDDQTGYAGAETSVTLTVNKGSTDSGIITEEPAPRTLTADGDPQELVRAGTAAGGRTILYALGSDAQNPPADGYSASIPTASEAGTYYVYYKIAADDNHAESEVFGPVIVEIAEEYYYTGKGEDHQIGSGEDSVFTIKRSIDDDQSFDNFKGILMDGADVDPENYSAARGSVIITLKAAYMDTLDPGEHVLTAVFEDGVETVPFNVTEPENFDVNVSFVFLRSDGTRGVPFDIKEVTLHPVLTVTDGEDKVTQSGALTVEITAGASEASVKATILKLLKDFAPGRYGITVSGLPEKMEKEVPDAANAPKYKVTAKAEINTKGSETVITVYLIWDNPFRYEEPPVYPLPEDEIGAYWIRKDGTKEYLLFHTYDICMQWLGKDELCRGPERCFHKDGK